MNLGPVFWLLLDLVSLAWTCYGAYLAFFKVPRLERDLRNARATIRGYLTARAERTPKVRK